jgi:peptidoglycan/LPS O-acetylase OafA/YrhL
MAKLCPPYSGSWLELRLHEDWRRSASMHVDNAGFYFVLMALAAGVAMVLRRVLPSERALLAEDERGGRLLTLDGLRGVLATSVFSHHAVLYFYFARNGNWRELPSNFYAQMGVLPVTLFFFITGYLFWSKLMKRPALGFLPFVKERLGRLGGAYWFACAVLFVMVMAESGYVRQVSWGRLFAEALGWLSFLGAGHDMNHLFDSKRLLGQVWTLRLEWMFYFSLPLFGWFARRRVRLAGLLAAALLLNVVIGRVNLGFSGAANFVWKMLGDYAQVLAVTFSGGMIVAAVSFTQPMKAWARSRYATALSGLLLLVTLVLVRPEHGLLETVLLVFPFACICFGNTWFGLLVSSPMRTLGRISYSFYLLHVFVLHAGLAMLSSYVAIGSLDAWKFWSFIAVCEVVAVMASYASYHYLEQPYVRRQKIRSVVLVSKVETVPDYHSPLRL